MFKRPLSACRRLSPASAARARRAQSSALPGTLHQANDVTAASIRAPAPAAAPGIASRRCAVASIAPGARSSNHAVMSANARS